MNAVSVNVSTYCDLEKISSDKFDPLIINTIPVEVQNLLPYCHDHHHLSDIALRYLLITLTHNKHFISSPSSAHSLHTPYCRHNNAGSRGGELLLFMFSIRSHNMLCCVTLSRVITLYKQYHTHPGPSVPHKGTNKDSSPWWWEADESHQNMLHVVFC